MLATPPFALPTEEEGSVEIGQEAAHVQQQGVGVKTSKANGHEVQNRASPEKRVQANFNHSLRRLMVANFLFVLSKDDNQAATRCFQFAQIAHSKIQRFRKIIYRAYGMYRKNR